MKTILTFVGGGDRDPVILQTALAAALPLSARLDCLHCQVPATQAARYAGLEFATGAALQNAMERLETNANVFSELAAQHFGEFCKNAGIGIGGTPTGVARRGVGGGPSVGSSNLYFEAGATAPDQIVGEVERGLLVTDLIGFGVDLVSGDFSQGAAGHWIEKGRLVHPVHEITIAGNLKQMLLDVDAVGSDLVFRGSSASPTLRIKRMTISGS